VRFLLRLYQHRKLLFCSYYEGLITIFHPNAQRRLIQQQGKSGIETFRNALATSRPWDSIRDFTMHPSFCGQKLYPRQLTLLKLIYLETENMSAYDIDVIDGWREGFKQKRDTFGVQPDIWQRVDYLKSRGYTHFPHVQAVLGRRASKGYIGGILGCERIAYLHSLDSWQRHYSLKAGTEGWLQVFATSQQQAQRTQFADIRYLVESCKYLQPWISSSKEGYFSIRTPADLRRIAELESQKVRVEREIASLKAIALSSNSATGRGLSTFSIFFDEMAHMIFGSGSTKSGEEIYDAAEPSLDQFGTDRLIYIPSSPFTKIGKFFELYRHGSVPMPHERPDGTTELTMVDAKMLGLSDDDIEEGIEEATAEPEMLIVQLPSWGLYEDWERSKSLGMPKFKRAVQVYNERMQRLEQRNPEKFKVERRGQFADVQGAYLDPEKVDAMFEPPTWRAPLEPQANGRLSYQYRIHCDPGRTNANFALAIGHLEDAPTDEYGDKWPHVIFDYLRVWKPTDFSDHTIDYMQVQTEIADILRRFPSTTKLSFDMWNSAGPISMLRSEFSPRIRIVEESFQEAANQKRAELFKSALNLGWIHSYRDDFGEQGTCLLEQEMKFLTEVNGKVKKQDFGPVTTKDLWDCVAVVSTTLLHEALDIWMKRLGLQGAFGSTDASGLRHGREFDRMRQAGMGSKVRMQMERNSLDRLRGRLDNPSPYLTRGGRWK
jgi:hypothetical protein